MTVLVDTDVFIRLLVMPRMGHLGRPFREARAFIEASERGDVEFTTSEAVVAEAVYVMTSVYKADRDEIAKGRPAPTDISRLRDADPKRVH